ncbi:MAG: AAA family ATPase [Bacteroidaceae bacterium]|nr:AAA family ATPase [Bacteroidaceae bacterium]
MKKQYYTEKFLRAASSLDAVTNCNGQLTKIVLSITENRDSKATRELCKLLQEIVATNKQNTQILEIAKALNKSLIEYYGYLSLHELIEENETEEQELEEVKSLEELLRDLDSLVGLQSVKSRVKDLIDYQKVQQLRRKNGLFSSKSTMHLAFTGNPGTGKTTVARIVGRIYKQLGLLSKGHFIEASRTDLIAGYQGQTALKVKKVIEKAKGGVLFIDEAYSITENEHSDSYGRECLTELTKALEDFRDDLVVIVAGYTEPMKKFFESNPGLKSRFNTFIEFNDYSSDELIQILQCMCKNNDYSIDSNTLSSVEEYFKVCIQKESEQFSNGRFVRNFFDDIVMNHARRVANIDNPTISELEEISSSDIKYAQGHEI